jgi:ferrochelatase
MPKIKNTDDLTAVILFNLGGPDNLEAVKPFLYNLFVDPAIIQIPAPFRQILAKIISTKRDPIAREIYKEIGGKSPILVETKKQEQALEKKLNEKGNYKVFTIMRYWHPFVEQVILEVKKTSPSKIILLPLYPQFSTTTTGSSINSWNKAAKKIDLNIPTVTYCCYGDDKNFINAHVETIKPTIIKAQKNGPIRLLFSAHGLPQKIVDKGDPYPDHVEIGVALIASQIKGELQNQNLDYRVCYQSRVGPLKWLAPSLEDEIKQAAVDKVGVVIVPIAFVSEHSETLVELDIEYKKLANELGITEYYRVPTLSTNQTFINCLAELVVQVSQTTEKIICPKGSCLNIKK